LLLAAAEQAAELQAQPSAVAVVLADIYMQHRNFYQQAQRR
jgi:hypothetical protein